jgi:hypothetical protein
MSNANHIRKMLKLMEDISIQPIQTVDEDSVVEATPLPRYIPQDSTEVKDDQSSAIVYISDVNGVPYGIGYSGKGGKSKWNYRFKTDEQRQKYIDQFFKSTRESEAYRKEHDRRAIAGAERGLEVGDIVYTSWGYDQTNVDFYQVIQLIGNNAAVMREVAQDYQESGHMSGNTSAKKDEFIGEPFRVTHIKNGQCKIKGHSAWKWDGKPKYTSSYA